MNQLLYVFVTAFLLKGMQILPNRDCCNIKVHSNVKNSSAPSQNELSIELDSTIVKLDSVEYYSYPSNLKYATLLVRNNDLDNVEVVNVYKYFAYPEIEVKKGNSYFSLMDSVCYRVMDPMLPKEGFQKIKFEKGESIRIRDEFPPRCLFYERGEYRLRYVYVYYLNNIKKAIQTQWITIFVKKTN